MDNAREEMLAKVRTALKRTAQSAVAPVPAAARIAPRVAGGTEAELAALFAEIEKLGGKTKCLENTAALETALREHGSSGPGSQVL